MIQRKQSLYLFLAGVIAILSVALNFSVSRGIGTFTGIETGYEYGIAKTIFNSQNATNAVDNQAIRYEVEDSYNNDLVYFVLLSGLLPLIVIFLYKKLDIQLRITALNFVFILGSIIYVFVKKHGIESALEPVKDVNWSFQFSLLALVPIFNYLAFKGIKKDIQTLASVDRLR